VQPTAQDIKNAQVRQAIADRQAEEYGQCLRWALGAFGPGWLPSGRHFLLDKAVEDECRRTGDKPTPAATVYTVKNAGGRKRHFTVTDGRVREVASYQEGFGPMLNEPHPTMRIEIRGQEVAPHRYSLCWAPIELYHPKSADELAALRESREEKKAEKEQAKFKEENPLLAWAELEGPAYNTDEPPSDQS